MPANTKEQIDNCIKQNYEKLVNYVNQTIHDINTSRDLVHDLILTIHKPSYENKLLNTNNIEQFLFEMAYYYRIKNGSKNIHAPYEQYTTEHEAKRLKEEMNNTPIDFGEYEEDDVDKKITEITFILENTNQLNWMEKQYVRDRLYCFRTITEYCKVMHLSRYMVTTRLKFAINILTDIYYGKLPLTDVENKAEIRLRKKYTNKIRK